MEEHRKQRRRHSAEFKSQVVQACSAPGASTAGVALAFGHNANLVRQWRKGRGFRPSSVAQLPVPGHKTAPAFVALAVPTGLASRQRASVDAESPIRIEARRNGLHVSVSWPSSAASECAIWLRELLR